MHKRIGLIGGTSPESTVYYYERIIHQYQKQFRDFAFPEIVIFSVNFQKFIDASNQQDWDLLAKLTIDAARQLEKTGCDFIAFTANTIHASYERVVKAIGIPVINLLFCLIEQIKSHGLNTVGLLGTRTTMEMPFYRKQLSDAGIKALVPDEVDRTLLNDLIYNELINGNLDQHVKSQLLEQMDKLRSHGAEGIILGCTEIPLVIKPEDSDLPLFDTAKIHADALLKLAVE